MEQTIIRLLLLLMLLSPSSEIRAQVSQKGPLDLEIKASDSSQHKQVDEIFAKWNNNETPGAAVAVVKGGKILYKQGYGIANLEYDIPITTNSIFHIASVSKQFTVFSILLLESQGKLSLDDNIRDYIPEVPDFGKAITLRHLASHTSGLRDQWSLLTLAGWRMDDVITKEHVLKLVAKQKELNFEPGEEYTYCNTGFTLLAEVVSRVADMSFAEFTAKNIFEPLGMANTLFYDDHEKIVKNRAYSYARSGEGHKKSVLNYANVGATSLFTTVEDLSLWAINFSEPTVGNSNIIEKMNKPATLNNGKTFGGALGQFVGEYKGLAEIQHGGADAGYRSYFTRFPEENLSVIVFSNFAEFITTKIAHDVADIFLGEKLVKSSNEQEDAKELKREELLVPPSKLATYIGFFELAPGFTVEVTVDAGYLFVQATGQQITKLSALSDTEFEIKGAEVKVEFVPNGEGNIESLKVYQSGQTTVAPRMQEFDRSSVDLSEFVGDYYSEELSTTYHFRLEGSQLVAKHRRLSNFNLNLMKEDLLVGEAWYFGQVKFIRDSKASITACKVSNGRVRNLYFEKVK